MSSSSPKHVGNKLIHEKSPYLQQHAANPVAWYPWGKEALDRARKENRPIFLSIGYSTCHWCHVMAHESFEDPETAALMNEHFVNIKVDREERPDLDAIYMDAVTILTGGGGWPMSVWLTPDLKPFYGGTYFPPEDRFGRPGFKTVLMKLAELWRVKKGDVVASADQLMTALSQISASGPGGVRTAVRDALVSCYENLKAIHDEENGGFGSAPKFPMPVYLDFLLAYFARFGDIKALEMAENTMKNILRGGITDQVGGGFHRYSTDAEWIVPHFEKMLYDNAQLISACVELYQATKNPLFKEGAEEAVRYVQSDLAHPDGGFYSAEDADSEGQEGAFYVWSVEEIKEVLGETLAEAFVYRYGLTVSGNFEGKNIPVKARSVEETAEKFGHSVEKMRELLEASRRRVLDVRRRRPRPHLDDKILTEWNGLMISALAKAGAAFDNEPAIRSAERAASFIRTNLTDLRTGRLYRRWRDGERNIAGHQADYAALVEGLLDLFEAGGNPSWLEWAAELQEKQDELFFDEIDGGYFMSEPRADLVVMKKDGRDNVIPSGNSTAVLNGYRLCDLIQKQDFRSRCEKTLQGFSAVLASHPIALVKMVRAMDFEKNGHAQIVIVGRQDDPSTRAMTGLARRWFLPQKTVIVADPGDNQNRLIAMNPPLKAMRMQDKKTTAYLCENFSCKNPVTNPADFRTQLQKSGFYTSPRPIGLES